MMSNKELSVTQKNTVIDSIAMHIQLSRLALYSENKCSHHIADNMARVLCFALYNKQVKNIVTIFDLKKHRYISELIEYYGINECSELRASFEHISKIKEIQSWEELLVYALEAFEYNPEDFINSEIKRGVHTVQGKKGGGIFYTPQDVVRFMIDESSNGKPWSERSCLDCSCGTGAFLIEIIRQICDEIDGLKDSLDAVEKCVWGIDISPNAVINCRFVLSMCFVQRKGGDRKSFRRMLDIFKNNIVQGDAMQLFEVIQKNKMPEQYSCIIGNPPYISMRDVGNSFIPFVYNMIDYCSDDGCSSLVVPLSFCTGKAKQYKQLRNRIKSDSANWKIINFDRSPDSLFGDHVKTRNTILVRNALLEKKVLVSGLIRWTSDNRNELFENIQTTAIDDLPMVNSIPKISEEYERELLLSLSNKKQRLSDSVEEKSNVAMYANATAYNWISVFDHIPESKDENGKLYIPDSLMKICFSTKDDIYFYIAMISNRITYWLWTLYGDGFHVYKDFIVNLPYGKGNFSSEFYNAMVDLGKQYVKKAKSFPYTSFNCGKEIVNYDFSRCFDIVKKIENIFIKEIGGSQKDVNKLSKWYDYHINCGRK